MLSLVGYRRIHVSLGLGELIRLSQYLQVHDEVPDNSICIPIRAGVYAMIIFAQRIEIMLYIHSYSWVFNTSFDRFVLFTLSCSIFSCNIWVFDLPSRRHIAWMDSINVKLLNYKFVILPYLSIYTSNHKALYTIGVDSPG